MYTYIMIGPIDTTSLEELSAYVVHAADVLTTSTAARDKFIRELLQLGATPTEIGRVANLSRERVYQIKGRPRQV